MARLEAHQAVVQAVARVLWQLLVAVVQLVGVGRQVVPLAFAVDVLDVELGPGAQRLVRRRVAAR